MGKFRLALLAGTCVLLQGCWAVYVPGSVLHNEADGSYCVSDNAKTGDRITMTDGKVGTVREVTGPSTTCPNPRFPVRANVTF